MADPIWVDGTTPLNSANMTKLQTRDEKGAPSGYVALNGSSGIDLSAAAIVKWGGDTNLYRSAANQLKTDGAFVAGAGSVLLNTNGYIYYGTAFDTYLGRAAAGQLAASGDLLAAGSMVVNNANGTGKLYFGSALDTNLYRTVANTLKTDGDLLVAGEIKGSQFVRAFAGTANAVLLGWNGSANAPAISFGSTFDTNLYRAAAATLKTDGYFQVAGSVALDLAGAGYKLYFGAAQDTNLFRYAPNALQTGHLSLNGQLFVRTDVANGSPAIFFGAADDTNLYRLGAAALKTDGYFIAGAGIDLDRGGSGSMLRFGSAIDTNLYRAGVGVLKTDGGIATASYGTVLPSAPVDGQEFTLVDSLTAPSYQWRFRFNAGASGSYKWEFIGGSPYSLNESSGNAQSTANTWTNYHTSGFCLAPRPGLYLVRTIAQFTQTGVDASVLVAVGNQATGTKSTNNYYNYIATGLSETIPCEGLITVTAANQLLGGYYQMNSGTCTEYRSNTVIIPLRVS